MGGRTIRAAGAVVIREGRCLAVHRPRFDDWTLPKGKLHRNEDATAAAVREVLEETGLRVRLGAPLPDMEYPLGKDTKHVCWWIGHEIDDAGHAADAEVDGLDWMTTSRARTAMVDPAYAELAVTALDTPPTTPLLIVRHGKAYSRKAWHDDDRERPLTKPGREQAERLIPLVAAYGVTQVLSSRSQRCLGTVEPYARQADQPVVGYEALTEESAEASPWGVTATMAAIAKRVARTGEPTLLCGHRPVLPIMLDALGVEPQEFAVADVLAVHLDANARPVATEFHPRKAS